MSCYSVGVWRTINEYFRKEFNAYVEHELNHLKHPSEPSPSPSIDKTVIIQSTSDLPASNYLDNKITKLINNDEKLENNLPNNNGVPSTPSAPPLEAARNPDEYINFINGKKSMVTLSAPAPTLKIQNEKGHEISIMPKLMQEASNVEIIYDYDEKQRIHQCDEHIRCGDGDDAVVAHYDIINVKVLNGNGNGDGCDGVADGKGGNMVCNVKLGDEFNSVSDINRHDDGNRRKSAGKSNEFIVKNDQIGFSHNRDERLSVMTVNGGSSDIDNRIITDSASTSKN